MAAAAAQGQQLQPVDFAANKINIRHGTTIGKPTCGHEREFKWTSGWMNERSREFRDSFLDAASASGIPTVASSSSVFSSAGVGRQQNAQFLVASAIAHIDFEGCLYTGYSRGKIAVIVDWEVFSPLEDKVVYRERTNGAFATKDKSDDLFSYYVAYAYRDAANKLMRSAGFRQAIARAPGAGVEPAAPVVGERWLLPALQPFQAPLQQNIDYITNAAVTIDTGRSHGSGFFLTPDGWIMTNAHVARGSSVVKVVLADGRFVYGQVVRTHDARDVALIKADGTGYPALPLRLYPVRLTEEVYAIGTPVDKKLRASVTRGIVSQFRTNERRLVDIQADVTTHGGSSGGPLIDGFGNVVGITYAGAGGARTAQGKNLGSGINFFIPIADALEKLNLQLGVQ
ncbi:MAG: S1C family serine protease [Rhodospirillales bacterium]